MINFSLSELVNDSTKLCNNDGLVERVSTNSKDCANKNTLFIALKGEKYDAHNFIDDAINNGAKYIGSEIHLDKNISYLKTNDTLSLLGDASKLVRNKSKAFVLSLTGSCGKTTVKEMTLSIMKHEGNCIATSGNFNNDVGVPLTLFNICEDTDYAIIEQGASHKGDIARTCKYVLADIAAITNIGAAHIEGFGSYDGVYEGKKEILDDVLSRGGIGIVPADGNYSNRFIADYNDAYHKGKIKTFGFAPSADVRIDNLVENEKGISFNLVFRDDRININLNLHGKHNAQNAACAAALAFYSGAKIENILKGLNDSKSISGRFNIINGKKCVIIDDAYNASYNSVIASIDSLNYFKNYKIMVFADMGELGDESVLLHQKVGKYASDKVDICLCLGPLAVNTVKAFGHHAMHFADHDTLIAHLKTLLEEHKDSYVLVKGSHAMHMEKIVKALV